MPTSTKLSDFWDSVAPAWEKHSDRIEEQSAPMTAALLAALDVQPGDRVLELAAGAGSLGPVWSKLVGSAGAVVVSDVSPAMVAAAARRNESDANVETAVVDASAIDRPDGSFDVVACRMGLMFTPDPDKAFHEIRRVLRPGGRMAVLTWAGPQHNAWATCVFAAFAAGGIVPAGAPPASADAFSLSDPVGVRALVSAAGFEEVAVRGLPLELDAEDADDHAALVTSLAPPLAAAYSRASEEARATARRAAAEAAGPFTAPTGVRFPALALLVTARAGRAD